MNDGEFGLVSVLFDGRQKGSRKFPGITEKLGHCVVVVSISPHSYFSQGCQSRRHSTVAEAAPNRSAITGALDHRPFALRNDCRKSGQIVRITHQFISAWQLLNELTDQVTLANVPLARTVG